MKRNSLIRILALSLAGGILFPGSLIGGIPDSQPPPTHQWFNMKRETHLLHRALGKMNLSPWQSEAVGLLLNDQRRMTEVFQIGSGLGGIALKGKIREVFEYTRTRIESVLTDDQRAQWSRSLNNRDLSFRVRKILAAGTTNQRTSTDSEQPE